MKDLLTTSAFQAALDDLVMFACHDGFADFGGSAGACESFTDEVTRVADQILRLDPQVPALELLSTLIEDRLDSLGGS
jgi:hypothetical protein